MAVTVGELDQRIVINHSPANPQSGQGGNPTYVELATVWAKVVDMTTRERLVIGMLSPNRIIKCTIRKRSDVTTGMQLVYDTRTYNIVGVTQTGTRTSPFTELLGEEKLTTS